MWTLLRVVTTTPPPRKDFDAPRKEGAYGSDAPREFKKPRHKSAGIPETRRELDEAQQAAKPRTERAPKPTGKPSAAPKRAKGAGDTSGKTYGGKPAAKYAAKTGKPGGKPKTAGAKPGKGKAVQGGGFATPKRQKS